MGDGATIERENAGCGRSDWPTKNPPWGRSDWCASVPSDIIAQTSSYKSWGSVESTFWTGCAFRAKQFPRMLQSFRTLKMSDNSTWSGMYNEIVVDGIEWDRKVNDYLWAFVVPDACFDFAKCLASFKSYYGQFVAQFGSGKVILGID